MYCEKCGSQLLPQARFCEACGAPVAQRPAPQVVAVTVAEPTPSPPPTVAHSGWASRVSLSPSAGWGIALAGCIGMAVAVLHSESVQDIPLALSYSFGRGLLPFAVGSYLLLARARPAWLALGLAAVVFALALLDLLRMYPLINLWDVQSTMGFYGVRLASDLLIVHAVALRLVQFKVKGQPP